MKKSKNKKSAADAYPATDRCRCCNEPKVERGYGYLVCQRIPMKGYE